MSQWRTKNITCFSLFSEDLQKLISQRQTNPVPSQAKLPSKAKLLSGVPENTLNTHFEPGIFIQGELTEPQPQLAKMKTKFQRVLFQKCANGLTNRGK